MKIGYVRVSSSKQNPSLQLEALQKIGCEKIYQEKKSAFKERPELQRALEDIRKGDILCVWSLDRLGRSMPEIRANIDYIQKKGADLLDITHNVDTSTASGKLLIPILTMLAEVDQVLREERKTAGWEIAKREGRTGGRPSGLSEAAQKKAEQAKKMYLSKDPLYSAREICSILNISSRTLYRYLRHVGIEPKGSSLINNVKDNHEGNL